MMLYALIIIPLAGGIAAWMVSGRRPLWPRRIALTATITDMVLAAALWHWTFRQTAPTFRGKWLIEVQAPWFPQLGISLHLALDGMGLVLVLLATFLGTIAVLAPSSEIRERTGFYHFNLLFALAGIIGVFAAIDLFLFYFFWELMLVPMFFLILVWGHERGIYAAVKFFIFTQLGGLLMLTAIIGLVFVHGRETGNYSFDYVELLDTSMNPGTAMLLFLGFSTAFLVKLPAVPFHTWLPDAHTEAPTAGSILLAGLLLKTGAYGLIRFAVPLFPEAAASAAPIGFGIGIAGILYGAFLAFAQSDLKRLIAYTSISHMGFVLVGVFAWNEIALEGVMIQIVCHGISTGALFFLAGVLQERLQTREMDRMGGLWSQAPSIGGVGLFFALASLGLPGLGNFIGEFLVLLGTWRVSVLAGGLAAVGFVLATVYALWMVWRAFFGKPAEARSIDDLSVREMSVMTLLAAVILWIGLFPQPLIDTARHGLAALVPNSSGTAPDQVPTGVQERWTADHEERPNIGSNGSGGVHERL